MKASSVKSVRCAIYTRVSTEHGLDQEFNSLDAQYEAASAYIKSQAHAGWTLIRSRYDDGGYSGADHYAVFTTFADFDRAVECFRGSVAEFLDAETGHQKSPPKMGERSQRGICSGWCRMTTPGRRRVEAGFENRPLPLLER